MESTSANPHKFYSEEEVAALIRELDRDEDYHIFAEDVLKTYPYLAESYTKVCPRRCDLATAAQKALDGAYSYDVKLKDLKEDIALIVSNCIAYNGPTSAYAETAATFERFALDHIDRFIVEHNGGRRLSRLRLPAASQEVQQQQQQLLHNSGEQSKIEMTVDKKKASSSGKTAAAGTSSTTTTSTAATTTTFAVPTMREVVQLVDSLNRREDGGAFSVDVAEAYPDLRESYQKMCPNPMNLLLMRQRAKEGFYTADAPPLFGNSVATSLTRLREDVELMVHNCITFNAKVNSWVTLARSFQNFAHRRIDDFVLRHATSLRGTPTGAQMYTSRGGNSDGDASVRVVASSSTASVPALASAYDRNTTTAATTTTSCGKNEGRKRERADERVGRDGSASPATSSTPAAAADTAGASGPAAPFVAAAPVSVKVVGEVAPQVRPTPLQPNFVIPPRLRRRLALEHLQHAGLPLRRVGVTVARAALYPDVVATGKAVPPLAEENEKKVEHIETETASEAASPLSTSLPSSSVTIDSGCSAAHMLRRLRTAVDNFFATHRCSSDFVDAFAFSEREAQTYRAVLNIIADEFERVAAHLLLYERESAEWAEYVALNALRSTCGSNAARKVEWEGCARVQLAEEVHYLYLVRFLVQWPQLACLCCTTPSPAGRGGPGPAAAGSAPQGSLRISRDQLKAMAQVAHITQEFLEFVEKFDERVSVQ